MAVRADPYGFSRLCNPSRAAGRIYDVGSDPCWGADSINILKSKDGTHRQKGISTATVLDFGGRPPAHAHITAMPRPEPSARPSLLLANPPTLHRVRKGGKPVSAPPAHPQKREKIAAGTRIRWPTGPIYVVSRNLAAGAEQQGAFTTRCDGILHGVLMDREENEREKVRIATHCHGTITASVPNCGGRPPAQSHIPAMPPPEPSARPRILLANPPTLCRGKTKEKRGKFWMTACGQPMGRGE
jgi:hypothetical protein